MKDSVIEKLFLAVESFNDETVYKKLLDRVIDSEEKFLKEIKDRDKILRAYTEFERDTVALNGRLEFLYFTEGFKMGVKLAFELGSCEIDE